MRAVRFLDGRPRVVERPEPPRPAGEALVRVTVAGLCGTDLELARGYLGFEGVPGHEFVGVVEQADDPLWVGRRVVGEINAGCGDCGACRARLARHCPRRTVLGIVGRDGAFADLVALPEENLHAVPDGVPDDVAVFTEPMAAAHEILEQLRPEPGTRAVVLGDGRLGQLCAAVLADAGSPPLVCGRHAAKLARLEGLGLATTRDPGTLPREFDLVVEATGNPEGLPLAMSLVRPRGTIVLKSTYHGAAAVELAGLVIDEIRLLGSRCGPFAPALAHLARQPDVVAGMVAASYPLERVADAFAHAARGDTLKVLLAP